MNIKYYFLVQKLYITQKFDNHEQEREQLSSIGWLLGFLSGYISKEVLSKLYWFENIEFEYFGEKMEGI